MVTSFLIYYYILYCYLRVFKVVQKMLPGFSKCTLGVKLLADKFNILVANASNFRKANIVVDVDHTSFLELMAAS